MSAKTDYQNKFAMLGTRQLASAGGSLELAGDVWDAKSMGGEFETVTANRTLTAADHGKVFFCATNAVVFTLPSTAAGLKFTFIMTGARTSPIVSISPQAADGISGTFNMSTVVVDAGVVDKDIQNTAATHEPGDMVTLLGTGTAGTAAWIVVASTGVWAAES
jgi:hypothetical protein